MKIACLTAVCSLALMLVALTVALSVPPALAGNEAYLYRPDDNDNYNQRKPYKNVTTGSCQPVHMIHNEDEPIDCHIGSRDQYCTFNGKIEAGQFEGGHLELKKDGWHIVAYKGNLHSGDFSSGRYSPSRFPWICYSREDFFGR